MSQNAFAQIERETNEAEGLREHARMERMEMTEQKKDYSKLRPFDLEAAKAGEVWASSIGDYMVSSLGRVLGPKGLMKPSETTKGYLRVCMKVGGKQIESKVHRLVASAFIENTHNYPQVNHINGNKKDNSVGNLEWCNNQQNMVHCRQVLRIGVIPLVAFNDFEVILFESWKDAERSGHNAREIRRCLNYSSNRHHGMYWSTKDDFDKSKGVQSWVLGKPVFKKDTLDSAIDESSKELLK